MTNIIGDFINTGSNVYEITEGISLNRDNADIYLCKDQDGVKYAAKYFCHGIPRPNIAYGKHNHYGRMREGSNSVFNEIREKSIAYNFIVTYHARIRHKNHWLIIMDYVQGYDLKTYLLANAHNEPEKSLKAIKAFAEELAKWHNNGFAHGDPHLMNCIIDANEAKEFSATLIDYSQIHHKDFHYCKKYKCFDPPLYRVWEDFENEFNGKLGAGFEVDIRSVQNELNLGDTLINEFNLHYYKNITFELK